MSGRKPEQSSVPGTVRLAKNIVSAYVSKNSVSADALPDLIRTVHRSLNSVGTTEIPTGNGTGKPAVPVSRSILPDYLVCLEDGRKLKMLKRYLRTRYGMSPEDYRAKWGLPATYPMVAPRYSEQRSRFAKKIGLGRRQGR